MAKAGRTRSSAGERMEAFAEDLGRLLGTARAKADNWMGQREQIAKQLAEIRDTATKLLSDLGKQAQAAVSRAGTRRTRPAKPPGRRRRRRKMSAAARAKIAAAQRLRWARQKQASADKTEKKKR